MMPPIVVVEPLAETPIPLTACIPACIPGGSDAPRKAWIGASLNALISTPMPSEGLPQRQWPVASRPVPLLPLSFSPGGTWRPVMLSIVAVSSMSHRLARSCGSPLSDPASLGWTEAGAVDACVLGAALGTGEAIVPRPTDGDGDATGAVVAPVEVQ